MQMSHCDDDHESASSGARHKGMDQVWTGEKFGNELVDSFQRLAVSVKI